MTEIRTGQNIWFGRDMPSREEEWLFKFTNEEIEELRIPCETVVSLSPDPNFISIEALDKIDLLNSLPNVLGRIKGFLENLENGLGFLVWRGFPVQTWDYKQTCAAFLIVGKCMGNLVQQNAKGHVLGHVKDLGLSSSDPNVRVYQTKERQTFHTDSCDIVGLLCLSTAKAGGLSSLVSSGTIFNEILKIDAISAAELLKPLPTDKRGEVKDGTLPYFNIPVYSEYRGYLTAIYQRQYINSSQRFEEAPRLTTGQIKALDLFDSLCDDPRLSFNMELEPGDMQFVNNHALLHDRTGFTDWDEAEKKRHLLRIWIAPQNARPLPPSFTERFGSVTVGSRGGINVPGLRSIAPLNIE